MHLLYLKTIELYVKSNLVVNSRFFYTDGRGEYIREFNNYLKENDIAYEITTFYLP